MIRIYIHITKKFFTMRLLRHWNRLPRDVVDVPSLEGHVGWGFEQPGLVEGIPAWQGGWNGSIRSLPTQTII